MRRYSVLLTVYGLVVAALARQRKVTISNPMSNRRRSGRGSQNPGLMTNALPVMVDTTRFTTFAALCADVDRQVGMLIEYEGCAFADIARELLRDAHVDATVPSASFTLYPQPIAPVLNGEPAVPDAGRPQVPAVSAVAQHRGGRRVCHVDRRARRRRPGRRCARCVLGHRAAGRR